VKRTLLTLAVACAATAGVPAVAGAATYFVSNPIDDSTVGPCVPGSCTLRSAIAANDAVGGGGTIVLLAGTMQLGSTIELDTPATLKGGTSDARATILVAPAGQAAIAAFVGGAPVTLENLTVTGATDGNAIYANGAAPLTLTNMIVRDNRAASVGFAAGLTYSGSNVVIQDSTFSGNSGVTAGAIYGYGGTSDSLQIRNSELRSNTSTSKHSAGAVYVREGTAAISGTRVTGNQAPDGGGITLEPLDGPIAATVSDSTLDGNAATATGGGGALYLAAGNASVAATLRSDTFLGNVAPTGGSAFGGLLIDVSLHDSVLAHDTLACSGVGPLVSLGHNVTDETSCSLAGAGDRQATDPLLGPLADNGGRSFTALPQAGSPLVDAADTACSATDQRGIVRPQGRGCDIGAAESSLTTPAPPPGTDHPVLPIVQPVLPIVHPILPIAHPVTPPAVRQRLGSLRIAPHAIHSKATLSWKATRAATLHLAVEVKHGNRWVAKVRFTLKAKAGKGHHALPAKVLARLRTGRYRLTAIAKGAKAVHVSFSVAPESKR
jgi:hypothetical protein